MASKEIPGKRNIYVEHFDETLLWRIDKFKETLGMNRSQAIQALAWRALWEMGESREDVRSAYDAARRDRAMEGKEE